MNKILGLTLTLTFLSIGAAFAETNLDYAPNTFNQTLKGSVVTVPAGHNFSVVATSPISSANLILGQTVSVALGSDFYYNGNLIAPAGSSVTGTVLEVAKAKHGSLNGKLL